MPMFFLCIPSLFSAFNIFNALEIYPTDCQGKEGLALYSVKLSPDIKCRNIVFSQ